MSLGRLKGVYALLHASHDVADHWVQRHEDALGKGTEGWPGRRRCITGGRHRSVVVAARIAAWLRGFGVQVTVVHRDVDKPLLASAVHDSEASTAG